MGRLLAILASIPALVSAPFRKKVTPKPELPYQADDIRTGHGGGGNGKWPDPSKAKRRRRIAKLSRRRNRHQSGCHWRRP